MKERVRASEAVTLMGTKGDRKLAASTARFKRGPSVFKKKQKMDSNGKKFSARFRQSTHLILD